MGENWYVFKSYYLVHAILHKLHAIYTVTVAAGVSTPPDTIPTRITSECLSKLQVKQKQSGLEL